MSEAHLVSYVLGMLDEACDRVWSFPKGKYSRGHSVGALRRGRVAFRLLVLCQVLEQRLAYFDQITPGVPCNLLPTFLCLSAS